MQPPDGDLHALLTRPSSIIQDLFQKHCALLPKAARDPAHDWGVPAFVNGLLSNSEAWRKVLDNIRAKLRSRIEFSEEMYFCLYELIV